MKRIFVPTSSGSDWKRLLAKPNLHWKQGYSAMSAAACWEDCEPFLPSEITSLLATADDPALSDLELLAAMPEWEVELPGGSRPSQTDVLAITSNSHGLVVLGVEAKVDEPFGPTLGEKRHAATPGQQHRLQFLEGELGCSTPLQDGIRYQLLHRTVSALITARQLHASTAVMIVHSFSPTSKWRADFDGFANALLARQLTPDLHELSRSSSPRLLIGWCRGAASFRSVKLP